MNASVEWLETVSDNRTHLEVQARPDRSGQVRQVWRPSSCWLVPAGKQEQAGGRCSPRAADRTQARTQARTQTREVGESRAVRLTVRNKPCRQPARAAHPPSHPFHTPSPITGLVVCGGCDAAWEWSPLARSLLFFWGPFFFSLFSRKADFRVRVTCQPGDQTQDSGLMKVTHPRALLPWSLKAAGS